MAITNIDQSGTTAQAFMNQIAPMYDWTKVVYDEAEENVTELWVSEKIYISLVDSKTVYVTHTSGAKMYCGSSNTGTFTEYRITITDKSLILKLGSYYMAIGETESTNGEKSRGVVVACSYVYKLFVFSDSMTSVTTYMGLKTANGVDYGYNYEFYTIFPSSTYHTQFVPIYGRDSQDHFTSLYWTFLGNYSTPAKVTVGDKLFYATQYLATEYTE